MINTYNISSDNSVLEKLKTRYIAFDTETTGLSSYSDRIIEVGAVLFEDGKIKKDYCSLIKVDRSVPASATSVNHITDAMLSQAPSEKEVYNNLMNFFGDAMERKTIICAHNATFDMKFISETFKRLGYSGEISYVDTLSLSRRYIRGLYNYKQNTVAEHLGLRNKCAHRAVSDAELCGKILWNILGRV